MTLTVYIHLNMSSRNKVSDIVDLFPDIERTETERDNTESWRETEIL